MRRRSIRNLFIGSVSIVLLSGTSVFGQIVPNRLFQQQGLSTVLNTSPQYVPSTGTGYRPAVVPGYPSGYRPPFVPGSPTGKPGYRPPGVWGGGGGFYPGVVPGWGWYGAGFGGQTNIIGPTVIIQGGDVGGGSGTLNRPASIFQDNSWRTEMARIQNSVERANAAPTPVTPSQPAPEPIVRPTKASIVLNVPDGAEVYLEGQLMKGQTGPVRRYATPELQPGKPYVYAVVVVWQEGERTIRREREIPIEAGDQVRLTFQVINDSPMEPESAPLPAPTRMR
ncbi:TIGR03000 domain-containing protein [Tuwongella immobilis]|uniref:TIGR03000 domain-containing protein n=1 Tax=Tuwongella immobilis TaxID=692036 RepID=A0A6C2YHU3_9BACT|nr:TIGR03000 domain-containing protein [Tuwongella immobilis]VIP00625.1 unnamed protein product [Tuwongella immobilis]VTR96668.1 unnamed protein product [Tuwongella immobilis]